MRSTTERMLLLKKRTDELKKRRKAKKHMLAVISYCSFCLAFLIAAVSALVCDLNFNGFEQMPLPAAASIFADKAFAGYAVVGILAFYSAFR